MKDKINNVTVLLKYDDRKDHLIQKLNRFEKLYKNITNFEVIIIKMKNENIELQNYKYKIKFVDFKPDIYETEIKKSENDFILIEHIIYLHKRNIFKTYENEIKNHDITCFRNPIKNTKINKNFISIIQKNKFFDCFIINKKSKYKYNLINLSGLKKTNLKYKIIETDDIKYIFSKKIPKKIFFYWDGSKSCYLTNLAFKTCVFHNPNWEINLYLPKVKFTEEIIWEPNETIPPHTIKYDDYDYFNLNEIKSLGINVLYIDYSELGLKENCNEIKKSDIFRWKMLGQEGGVWSDNDILFIDSLEKINLENFNCKYNNIETVISQYDKKINNEDINFYYIGFLLSSENNSFYKIMHKNSIKNIQTKDYQGVGADLMKKILKKQSNINQANLNYKSVYYYWWAELKELFLLEPDKNFLDITYLYNDSIIGFHWFRGVYLSKIYSLFLNYEKKIQNFTFNGLLPKFVEYYKNIFHDFHLGNEKKISIIIIYENGLEQLNATLKSISKTIYLNYEIIIFNKSKDILNFPNIKIISNKSQIEESSGEILIFQNSNCCHVGDILTVSNCILKENDYLFFNTYLLNDYDKNKKIYELIFEKNEKEKEWKPETLKNILKDLNEEKNWLTHFYYKKKYYPFCVAVYKKNIKSLDDIIDFNKIVKKNEDMNLNYFCCSVYENEYPALNDFITFVIYQHNEYNI